MKTRILFVDDELNILSGLQRMLRPLRTEWDMRFASGGEEALALLKEAPADVVVSDMRMPGMNGAQLLNEVMRLYPQSIRLILSGHSDYDLILRSVGSTHQFLSKPCTPEQLKSTIDRAAALCQSLHQDAIQAIVSQMQQVPSLPAFYRELQELLQTGQASIKEVGKIISKDIGMTAGVLKVVNSAFFGLKRTISNAEEAANFLGVDTIKSLALGLLLFRQHGQSKSRYFCADILWAHSLRTAATARVIARLENAGQKIAEESFVAGLLADCGQLILSMNFGDRVDECYERGTFENLNQCEAEQKVFGTTHADIGAYLLGLWGLPVPIVEAIAWHHTPMQANHKEFSPLTAVYIASSMETDTPGAHYFAKETLNKEYLLKLGLADHVELWSHTIQEQVGSGNSQ